VLLHNLQGCGVRVPWSPIFGPKSESLVWRNSDSGPYLSRLALCNFVAAYLTFVQLILQLKLCLYTVVHLLLEEFKNFSQVILKYTIIMSHNNSWSRCLIFGPESKTGVQDLPRCVECRRGIAMRKLSVRQSVKCVYCNKTDFYTIQMIIWPSFLWEEEWLVGATHSTWNFGSAGPLWSEIADFQPIFARSASAVTSSKKVQLTLMGSPPRAFQWA